jgi:hypothetical protein
MTDSVPGTLEYQLQHLTGQHLTLFDLRQKDQDFNQLFAGHSLLTSKAHFFVSNFLIPDYPHQLTNKLPKLRLEVSKINLNTHLQEPKKTHPPQAVKIDSPHAFFLYLDSPDDLNFPPSLASIGFWFRMAKNREGFSFLVADISYLQGFAESAEELPMEFEFIRWPNLLVHFLEQSVLYMNSLLDTEPPISYVVFTFPPLVDRKYLTRMFNYRLEHMSLTHPRPINKTNDPRLLVKSTDFIVSDPSLQAYFSTLH